MIENITPFDLPIKINENQIEITTDHRNLLKEISDTGKVNSSNMADAMAYGCRWAR